MDIYCETFVLNEITGKTLLKVIDEMVDEHFFKKDGLLELGWCSHYTTYSGIVCYTPLNSKIAKTSIVEFYWLNSSKNRFYNQETLTKISICNCTNCKFLGSKNIKKRNSGLKSLFYLVLLLFCFIFVGIIIEIECNSG